MADLTDLGSRRLVTSGLLGVTACKNLCQELMRTQEQSRAEQEGEEEPAVRVGVGGGHHELHESLQGTGHQVTFVVHQGG